MTSTSQKITISPASVGSGCRSQGHMRPMPSSCTNHQRPKSIMQEYGMPVRSRTKDKWEFSNCHTTLVCAGVTRKILKPSGYQCCLTMHQRTQLSGRQLVNRIHSKLANEQLPSPNEEANTHVHKTSMHGRETNELNAMRSNKQLRA